MMRHTIRISLGALLVLALKADFTTASSELRNLLECADVIASSSPESAICNVESLRQHFGLPEVPVSTVSSARAKGSRPLQLQTPVIHLGAEPVANPLRRQPRREPVPVHLPLVPMPSCETGALTLRPKPSHSVGTLTNNGVRTICRCKHGVVLRVDKATVFTMKIHAMFRQALQQTNDNVEAHGLVVKIVRKSRPDQKLELTYLDRAHGFDRRKLIPGVASMNSQQADHATALAVNKFHWNNHLSVPLLVLQIDKDSLRQVARWNVDNPPNPIEGSFGRFRPYTVFFNPVSTPPSLADVKHCSDATPQRMEQFAIVMPRYASTLDKLLQKQSLSFVTRLMLISDLFLGASSVHENKVVHHDIKPPNIAIRKTETPDGVVYEPVFVDFGLAASTSETTHHARGTTGYLAPEILACAYLPSEDKSALRKWPCQVRRSLDQTELLGDRVDVWSLGVVAYEILMGELPWMHCDDTVILGYENYLSKPQRNSSYLDSPKNKESLEALLQNHENSDLIQTVVALLRAALRFNERERPSALQFWEWLLNVMQVAAVREHEGYTHVAFGHDVLQRVAHELDEAFEFTPTACSPRFPVPAADAEAVVDFTEHAQEEEEEHEEQTRPTQLATQQAAPPHEFVPVVNSHRSRFSFSPRRLWRRATSRRESRNES